MIAILRAEEHYSFVSSFDGSGIKEAKFRPVGCGSKKGLLRYPLSRNDDPFSRYAWARGDDPERKYPDRMVGITQTESHIES
jgi:hypothetical protein